MIELEANAPFCIEKTQQWIGLYIHLKHHEDDLDINVKRILQAIETRLYKKLSIEQIETLEVTYTDGLQDIARDSNSSSAE
jgi:hypothetical protein